MKHMAYEICDSDLKEKYFFRVPYAHYLADYIWPGFMISPQRLMHVKDMRFNEEDVIIASYPKSGMYFLELNVKNLNASIVLHCKDVNAKIQTNKNVK